jgi:hypothetical protein
MGEEIEKREGIVINGHNGTWYVIDEKETVPYGMVYLLEHEVYGDMSPCLIVDANLKVLVDDVYNGLEELDYEE